MAHTAGCDANGATKDDFVKDGDGPRLQSRGRLLEITRTTVRSDAEERTAWNDKNVPAWPKNISVFLKFWPTTFYSVWDKNIIRMQPEDKNV